jgi:hypothetical protein
MKLRLLFGRGSGGGRDMKILLIEVTMNEKILLMIVNMYLKI